jgi:hypothetical protein
VRVGVGVTQQQGRHRSILPVGQPQQTDGGQTANEQASLLGCPANFRSLYHHTHYSRFANPLTFTGDSPEMTKRVRQSHVWATPSF